MPFPVDAKYVDESEAKLAVKLPADYREAISKSNGGEFSTEEDDWELYKIRDSSDPKRVSRSMNDIVSNTLACRQWKGFPENAIAIASNGCGDQLVFIAQNGICESTVYIWYHESGQIDIFCKNFIELSKI